MLTFCLALSAGLALLTLVHVYRGGRTLNDHVVAAIVTGTHAVYPLLAWAAADAGAVALTAVHCACAAGNVGVWSLFFLLDRRREAGAWMPLAWLSQPAHAFALWTGLLLCFWVPVVGGMGVLGFDVGHPFWPGAALVLPLLLAGGGCLWTAFRSNRRTALTLRSGPGRVRIVHLSDLHASPVMQGRDLRSLVERSNAEHPDLVVITGDLLMPFSEAEHDYLLEALAGLDAPTVVVPGNHDLPVAETLASELRAIGLTWLADEQVEMRVGATRVEIVGMDFRWRGAQTHLADVLAAHPPVAGSAVRLLLVHDPRVFRFVPAGRFDLVLSGHTHGGQIGLDLPGFHWSVLGLLGAYDGGRFERDGTVLYVHRGNWHTGWPPRMGIAGELAVIDVGLEPPVRASRLQATP